MSSLRKKRELGYSLSQLRYSATVVSTACMSPVQRAMTREVGVTSSHLSAVYPESFPDVEEGDSPEGAADQRGNKFLVDRPRATDRCPCESRGVPDMEDEDGEDDQTIDAKVAVVTYQLCALPRSIERPTTRWTHPRAHGGYTGGPTTRATKSSEYQRFLT